jgi:hypothetical protein
MITQGVTCIGGVFFMCANPKRMTEWHQQRLGDAFGDDLYRNFIPINPLRLRPAPHAGLGLAEQDSTHFEPSANRYTLNFPFAELPDPGYFTKRISSDCRQDRAIRKR